MPSLATTSSFAVMIDALTLNISQVGFTLSHSILTYIDHLCIDQSPLYIDPPLIPYRSLASTILDVSFPTIQILPFVVMPPVGGYHRSYCRVAGVSISTPPRAFFEEPTGSSRAVPSPYIFLMFVISAPSHTISIRCTASTLLRDN